MKGGLLCAKKLADSYLLPVIGVPAAVSGNGQK